MPGVVSSQLQRHLAVVHDVTDCLPISTELAGC